MLKINYEFTALQPIHTGSDENTGTERKLRREKILIDNPIIINSNFKSHEERRDAILTIFQNIWDNIDFEGMSKSRNMGIYNEFTSKILASTRVRNKYQFLAVVCQKLDIRSLSDTKIIDLIDKFNDDEFLTIIRDEIPYLILRMRLINKKKKEDKNKDLTQQSLFIEEMEKEESSEGIKDLPPLVFKKFFESVPIVSGNGIRGLLRRVMMYDFCKRAGITALDKNIYHQLFTGGNITDSTGKESLEQREKFISMCPVIGLFGSAIGNQTIEGELNVSAARPKCMECSTGEVSFWELIETRFQTRLDSSKTEVDIKIIEPISNKKDNPTQMKYEHEVFIKGTKFEHEFAVKTDDKLLISCFWHMMEVFKENNYIGGNSARDSGKIDINLEIPEGSTELYLNYLNENKEEILEYFQSKEALSRISQIKKVWNKLVGLE